MFVSDKNLFSRLSGVIFETLFSSVTNNFHSNSVGRLIPTNSKLIIFLLSVSTLLFAIFILFYHVRPCFHVNDLLHNRIREKRIKQHLDKELQAFRLKKHKDFWIHKLKTLDPHGFNAELNFPNP